MAITVQTRKMLWGRSGNRCAFEGCGQLLIQEVSGARTSVIGEEAHIVGRESRGPRGESALPLAERDNYENLILLCPAHHKIIDDHPEEFTIAVLSEMKQVHETTVSTDVSTDERIRQQDEE